MPEIQRLIYEAEETDTQSSCFDTYIAEAFAAGMRYQRIHSAPHVMDPEPCMACGSKPSIRAVQHVDGVLVVVECRRYDCDGKTFVRRKSDTLEDALGRAVAAWNDMQTDYE